MKVIILGAGGRGNVYAKYFSENGVEIAGLADPNTERLHKVANSNGIPEASLYHSWEEVLEKPKFADAVVNATTDHLLQVSGIHDTSGYQEFRVIRSVK